ncbi:MAG: DUF3142 domain-containing protein [Planctomycetes bacterium]|nr:DUF3142 domain-containing protein [Planctomycetota bacterium]
MRSFAKSRFVRAGLIAVGAAIVLMMAVISLTPRPESVVKRQSGPIAHQAYIWQRKWQPALTEAVNRAGDELSAFCVLAAEVSWDKAKRQTVRVGIDYASLKARRKPIDLALRIGPYAGPFKADDETMTFLTALAREIIDSARTAGMQPAELQIDFDCAESKLDGYRTWIAAFKRAVPDTPVVITALPSWLNRKAFARLAKAADGYVLQVHSLERPTSPNQPIVLCDPAKSQKWVERAARIGVDFTVALPTYGYLVAFDETGGFVGLSAEGPSQNWPAGFIVKRAMADPQALATLVKHWLDDRPAAMKGIIWYRLPVETDQLNWTWTTLATVARGIKPKRDISVNIEYSQPQLAEVILANNGQLDENAAVRIRIACPRQNIVAADGLRGFVIRYEGPSHVCLEYTGGAYLANIPTGEKWNIGWLRLKQHIQLEATIQKPGHETPVMSK